MKKLSVTRGTLVLIACSNPQDPTESNFKAAIQDYYSKKQACFNIRAEFPYQIAKRDYSYLRDTGILNELVSIGLLKSSDSVKDAIPLPTRHTTEKISGYNLFFNRDWKGLDKST